MFSLLTVDNTNNQAPLQEYDRITSEVWTRIMGSPFQDLQWSQATLATYMSRLGLEHPRSEGWSYPCLFCGTQVTRNVSPSSCKKIITRKANFAHF